MEDLTKICPKQLTEDCILAGPILRRTEKDRVCIWLATNYPVGARGEVYDATAALEGRKGERGPDDVLGVGETNSIRLGQCLFVTLLEVRPFARRGVPYAPFPFDRLLAYDIALWPFATGRRGGVLRLAQLFPDASIDDPHVGIAYAGLNLPTFYLPSPDRRERNIVHGSCRKLHGEGGDALGLVDWMLRFNASAPGPDGRQSTKIHERPSALLLTGDQVYLDDVAAPLIPAIRDIIIRTMHKGETVPTGLGLGEKNENAVQLRDLTAPSLAPLLTKILSGEAAVIKNQLVSFAEMAALYLLSWHPRHWPDSFGAVDRKLYPREVARLLGAKAALPAIRRTLANVPTYMIFDDHDVTDDWNIDEKWKTRVETSPLGRRVVANALAAYWAFQGWGNDPDGLGDLKDVVQRGLADRSGDAGREMDRALLEHPPWGFVAPTVPEVIMLDTRTHRRLDRKRGERAGSGTAAPRLLDDDGLARFARDAEAVLARSPDKVLVVVAPSPIFNVRATESGNAALARLTTSVFADLELWGDNPAGYIDMVTTLAGLPAELCVILSGDVHYGFAQEAALFTQDAKSPPRRISPRFLQLTSSALQNLHTELNEQNTLVDILRGAATKNTYLKLQNDPVAPSVEVFHTNRPQGTFVHVKLLEADSRPSQGGDRVHYPKMMIKQSNVGQLEIQGIDVRHTFHMRDFDEDRYLAPRGSSPRSPVVTYRPGK